MEIVFVENSQEKTLCLIGPSAYKIAESLQESGRYKILNTMVTADYQIERGVIDWDGAKLEHQSSLHTLLCKAFETGRQTEMKTSLVELQRIREIVEKSK